MIFSILIGPDSKPIPQGPTTPTTAKLATPLCCYADSQRREVAGRDRSAIRAIVETIKGPGPL